MNFSVVIIILLPMFLDVFCTGNVSSVLELFPEFVMVKEKINKIKKGVFLAHNRFNNYRVNGEHIQGAVALSGRECWTKCIEAVSCTAANFQSEGGICELSRVTYISYDVLTRAVGWEVFTSHTPVGTISIADHSVMFTVAEAHCGYQGLSIAKLEDLKAANKFGYQNDGCGWAADKRPYVVRQGVLGCPEQSAMKVYCKPRKTELKIVIQKGGERMTLDEARSNCLSKRASLATMEDMLDAYYMGFQSCECGWASNGYSYRIMQNIRVQCMDSIGIISCTGFSTWNAWCKFN